MNNFFLKIFSDFFRILSIISRANRVKAYALLVLLAVQSAVELFFILTIAYMAQAVTAPEALNSERMFRALYFCFPALKVWGQDPRYLVLIASSLVITVSIAKSLISYTSARATFLLSERISIDIGHEIMERFLHSDYAWHLSSESGTTFQRMQWRGNLSLMLVSQLSMYACMLTMVVLFCSLVAQEPVLTTIVVGVTGSTGLLLYRGIRKHVDREAQRAAESAQEETRALMCATRGVRDVLIYRQQKVFLQAITSAAEKGMLPRTFNAVAPTIPTWVLEAMGFLMVFISLSYLIFVEQAGVPRITTALGLLMLTAWRVLPYANRVVGFQISIRAVRPMVLAVLELLESLRKKARIVFPEPDKDFTLKDSISFRHVYFRYPETEADSLSDITLTIPVGKKVGIIGPSGGGKSTLVGILSGLLCPKSGEMLVDGAALTPSRAAAFVAQVGYVPQAPFLFAGTLAENIAFSQWGQPWDEARVRDACRRAAIDFVDSHPLGLKQPIGENGAGLSGGQAQRVSIARAMYASPKLLIFDEATSALDQANEKNIQETILQLADEVTCVIVAHRLTTVEHCDWIVWLDKGRISMQGPAEAILAQYRCRLLTSGTE